MTDSDSADNNDSDSSTPDTFPPAGPVIEAFGGIRPMAARLDVPVSTVQGWKQRDAIPENRFDQIRAAAAADGIDFEALPAAGAAEPDDDTATAMATDSDGGGSTASPLDRPAPPSSSATAAARPAATPAAASAPAAATPTGKPASSGGGAMAVAILALLVAIAAGGWVWWSQQQAGGGALGDEVAALKTEIAKLSAAADRPAATPQQVSALSDRLDTLAQKIDGVAANAGDGARLDALDSDIAGLKSAVGDVQKSLSSATAEMASLRTGVDSTMSDISARLVAVENRDDSAVAREARAVGLAIAVNEIRRTLRSGAPYAGELATLRQLADGDADLAAPVATLAASSADGLPSAATLARRFAALIPPILSADRVADDAPWYQQALDRATGMVSIRRVGADATGDTADAVIARAEAMLADGDLSGAVKQVETLQGAAATAAAPWLADARLVVAAEAAVAQINSKALATLAASRSQ